VVNVLRKQYATIEEAEMNFGLTIDVILNGKATAKSPKETATVHNGMNILSELKNLEVGQLVAVINECLSLLEPHNLESIIRPAIYSLSKEQKLVMMDKMFADLCQSAGIIANLRSFVSLSVEAMSVLQNAGKPNLIHKWAKCIVGENGVPLMPINRMPFGLIQYQMEFFTSTNIMQVGL
jgi:hypothetical protein